MQVIYVMEFNNKNMKKIYPLVIHNPFSLFKPVTWFSALIRLATYPFGYKGTKWNHTANLYQDLDDEWYVTEATGKGVYPLTLATWLEHSPDRKAGILIDVYYKNPKILKLLWGVRYDFKIIWQFTLWLLCKKWFGVNAKITKWFDNEYNRKRFFCSEYTAAAIGLNKPHQISPKDISELGVVIETDMLHFYETLNKL